MFPDSTSAEATQPGGRSVFAGRFQDLPESEQRRVGRDASDPGPSEPQPEDRSGSFTNIVRSVKSHLHLGAHEDNHASSGLDARGAGAPETTLYLVRPNQASSALALDRARVTLNTDGRRAQIAVLKEFRSDTQRSATSEIRHWVADQLPSRPYLQDSGVISAGLVLPMTAEEATRLARDVPGLVLMQNRALTLIAPVNASMPVAALPPTRDARWHLDAIGLSLARKQGRAYSGRGVNVAVLDTGIACDHPAIANKVGAAWKIRNNPNTIDFTALEPDALHHDTSGHGTHVAGLICGDDTGVAPDARLVSLLLMPRGRATTFDFMRCLDWAGEHPEINLVNCSAGITPFTDELMAAVSDLTNTGALLFAAVGNSGANHTRTPGNYIDGVSVGAVDAPGLKVSSYSGSGQLIHQQLMYTVPDLVAPGSDVWSSYPGDQYISLSGTSMATPIVTGIAACLIEQAGGLLSPPDLTDLLARSCKKLAGEPDIRQGAGLVQVS